MGVIKINLGCGQFKLRPDWVNVDADPRVEPDVTMTVPPLHFADGEAEEIYCGHLLEHLRPEQGAALLAECYRVLQPGGRLGVVVPDTREIMRRWLEGSASLVEMPPGRFWRMDDLDHVCATFLFSTYQDSPHQWAYDADTLARTLELAGFEGLTPIDPLRDPRLVPAWWNLGYSAVRP